MSLIYQSQTSPSTVQNLSGFQGNFVNIQTEQLSVGHSPQTFVVGTPQFPTITSALERVQGVQARETTIQIMPGVYNETLKIDHLASSMRVTYDHAPQPPESRGLYIVGDTRPYIGGTYLSGARQEINAARIYNNFNAPTSIIAYDPPVGTVHGGLELQNVPTIGVASNTVAAVITIGLTQDPDDYFVLPGPIIQPDFGTMGVASGDRILLRDTNGLLSIRNVVSAIGNQVTFDGAAVLFDTNGAAMTFLPNVTVLNNSTDEPTCVISGCDVTMRGVNIQVDNINVRWRVPENLLIAGSANALMPNCTVLDLERITDNNIELVGNGTLLLSDKSSMSQEISQVVTGLPGLDFYDDRVLVAQLPFTVVGGGNAQISPAGSAIKIIGGKIMGGALWVINSTRVINQSTGIQGVGNASDNELHSLQMVGWQNGLFIRTTNFHIRLIFVALRVITGMTGGQGAILAVDLGHVRVTGATTTGTAFSMGVGWVILNGFAGFGASNGIFVENMTNVMQGNNVHITCPITAINVTGTKFLLRNGSKLCINGLVTFTSSPGVLSDNTGESELKMVSTTGLVNNGNALVITANGALDPGVQSILLDSAAPRAVTLNPASAIGGLSQFGGRIFTVYGTGPMQPHTLTLTTGNYVGVPGAGPFTVATFNGTANEGNGLTFKVVANNRVQVLAFNGVVFT